MRYCLRAETVPPSASFQRPAFSAQDFGQGSALCSGGDCETLATSARFQLAAGGTASRTLLL